MYVASQVTKHYGGVRALEAVDLEIHPGEVQALLGANGAGKSTLVKILVGAERPTSGTLALDGAPVHFSSVEDARAHGVAIVSQELNLFPDLDVLENMFLGHEPRYGGALVNRREMTRQARGVLDAVGLEVPVNRRIGTLRLGEQQLVEIARALLGDPKILFLDEPTSALQAAETQRLLDVVRRLRDRGVAVVYVSHFLEDVFAIADTVTVLRNGRLVGGRRPRSEMTIPEAIGEMLGDTAATERKHLTAADPMAHAKPANDSPLILSGITIGGALEPFDLVVQPGEVVGLAGLDGSGPHLVLDAIFGRAKLDYGTIELPGGGPAPRSPSYAVRAGVAFVPADRKRLGVMLDKAIYENVCTVAGGPLKRMGFMLRNSEMIKRTEHWGNELRIKMDSPRQAVNQLSGGNQQKVVFAKWLETGPKVVLMDDPSRGVDVSAKVEMHTIIAQMAARKRIILITSSDLEELADVCDRVVVFFQGRAVGEISGEDLSEPRLLQAINTGDVAEAGVQPLGV